MHRTVRQSPLSNRRAAVCVCLVTMALFASAGALAATGTRAHARLRLSGGQFGLTGDDIAAFTADIVTTDSVTGIEGRLVFDPDILQFRTLATTAAPPESIVPLNTDGATSGVVRFAISRFDRWLGDYPNDDIGLFLFDVVGQPGDRTTVTLELDQVLGPMLPWDGKTGTSALDGITTPTGWDAITSTSLHDVLSTFTSSALPIGVIADLTPRTTGTLWMTAQDSVDVGAPLTVSTGLDIDMLAAGVDCRMTFDPSVLRFREIADAGIHFSDILIVGDSTASSGVLEFSVSRFETFAVDFGTPYLGHVFFDAIGGGGTRTSIALEAQPAINGPIDWTTHTIYATQIEIGVLDAVFIPPTGSATLVGASQTAKGDVYRVTARIDTEAALTGADCRLVYDPAVFQLRDVNDPGGEPTDVQLVDTSTSGTVRFAISRTERLLRGMPNEAVAQFTFDVVGEGPDWSAIGLYVDQAVAGAVDWSPITTTDDQMYVELLEPPSPAPDPSWIVMSHRASPGDILRVQAGIDTERYLAGADVRITFDPHVLAFRGAADRGLEGTSDGQVLNASEASSGTVGLAVSRIGQAATDWPEQPIADLLFDVVGSPGASSPIDFQVDQEVDFSLRWEVSSAADASDALTVGSGATSPALRCRLTTESLPFLTTGTQLVLPIELEWDAGHEPHIAEFSLLYDTRFMEVDNVRLKVVGVGLFDSLTTRPMGPGEMRFLAMGPGAGRSETRLEALEILATVRHHPPLETSAALLCRGALCDDGTGRAATATVGAGDSADLELEIERGTVEVSVSPEGASWTVRDEYYGETTGSGDATLDDAPMGEVSVHWGDVAHYVTPDPAMTTQSLLADQTLVFAATYALETHTLAIAATNGDVARAPDLAQYPWGTTVTLTPQPDPDFHFVNWTGDVPPGSESDNPLTIVVDGDLSLTAHFEPDPTPTPTWTPTPTPSPSPTATATASPTPTATPRPPQFELDQTLAVETDGHVYAVVYDLNAGSVTDWDDATTNTTLSLETTRQVWFGAYLYDYDAGNYVEGAYVYHDSVY